MSFCLSKRFSFLDDDDEAELANLVVPIPVCELDRLQLLRETRLLDSQVNDGDYERFVNLAARTFRVSIALVSLIDVSRQWFKAKVGLDASETSRDVAFCAYTILESTENVFVVYDATLDDRFKNNPLVLGKPFIRFYAGAPIILQGIKIGTLCIIDQTARSPAQFGEREKEMLSDIAAMISALVREKHHEEQQQRRDLHVLAANVLHGLDVSLSALTAQSHVIEKAKNECLLQTAPKDLHLAVCVLQDAVRDFQLQQSATSQLLEQRLLVAQRILGNHARPKTMKNAFPDQLNILRALIPRICPNVDENAWLSPLRSLIEQFDTAKEVESHPEVLSLVLCRLITAPGQFLSLSSALATQEHERTMSGKTYHGGEITFCMTRSFSSEDELQALQDVTRALQEVQWIGGKLSLAVQHSRSHAVIRFFVPFRSVCAPSVEEKPLNDEPAEKADMLSEVMATDTCPESGRSQPAASSLTLSLRNKVVPEDSFSSESSLSFCSWLRWMFGRKISPDN